MTGGVSEAKAMNEILAVAANEVGVGVGLGSMRAMLENEDLIDTFDIKELAQNVPVIGNIGLVQMNYGVEVDDLKRLVHRLGLDALSVHLNPLQEALQPEGDTDFSGLRKKLQVLVSELGVPVIVKDVGVGVSGDVISELVDIGVQYVDVSGAGGTSWAYIEGERSDFDLAAPFVHEGFKTPDLLEQQVLEFPECNLIAGGGIRSGVDMFKSIALGAVVANAGRPFALEAAKNLAATVSLLEKWKKQFEICMFVTGVSKYDDVVGNRSLLVKNNG